MTTIIEPKYKNYFQRSLNVNKMVAMIFFVLLILGLLGDSFFISMLIIIFLSLFIFTVSLIQNSKYLEKIEINDNTNTLIVKTRLRDKANDIQEYLIEDIIVKIKKIEISYPTYILEIYHNKKRIIKQRTVGGWNTDYFIQILKKINEIQGKKTFVDYIR